MSTILAIFGIILLIISHELGHFLAGKMIKIPIYEFAIGMGPAAITWNGKSGTKFSIRILPIGGFCSFDDPEELKKKKALTGVTDPSIEKLPLMKRLFIYIAGPFANMLVAFMLSFLAYSIIGNGYVTTEIRDIIDGQPAQLAGLEKGDNILELDGVQLNNDGNLLTEVIRNGNGKTTIMVYSKSDSGEIITTSITPVLDDSSGFYRIGTYQEVVSDHFDLMFFLQESLKDLWRNTAGTIVGIADLLTGKTGLKNTSGVIGAVDFMQQYATRNTVGIFLHLLSLLSVNLCLMNLLPIPALDGGKCIIAIAESIFGHKMSEKWNIVITGTTFIILMCLMFFLAIQDIHKIITP